MSWLQYYDFFLFDFDGLLVDTEKLHFKAYQLLCQNYGLNLSWSLSDFFQHAHSSSNGLEKAFYSQLPLLYQKQPKWSILHQEKRDIYQMLLHQGKLSLMPGVEKLLLKLQEENKNRCVVTNSSIKQVDFIRQQIPLLDSIPYWLTREMYDKPKPFPDGYLKALKQWGSSSSSSIGFEDSLKGLTALQQAKIDPCILICSSHHPQLNSIENGAFFHFPSMEDFMNFFNPLRN